MSDRGSEKGMEFRENLKATRIVPVIVIKELGHAVPLAKALVEGGLDILEITLRTGVALEAIRAIAREVPGAVVGAGTVINRQQFESAAAAGARFVVSPGLTEEVAQASRTQGVPILPGCMANFELETHQVIDAGDHRIFIGRILKVRFDPEHEPLVYLRGRFRRVHTD